MKPVHMITILSDGLNLISTEDNSSDYKVQKYSQTRQLKKTHCYLSESQINLKFNHQQILLLD